MNDFDWVQKTSSKDAFNIEEFYGVTFYELNDEGEPKTWRGIPSKFYIKDVGDSKVVEICKEESEMCSMYGKGAVVNMFTRGDWVFVYEYVNNLKESNDLDWIGETDSIDIGGMGVPKDTAKLGDTLKTKMGYTFTLEEISGGDDDNRWVWGSDLGVYKFVGNRSRGEKNWHNPKHLVKVNNLKESDDFEWIEELPQYKKVPIWDGRDRGTPEMGVSKDTIYIYNDKEFKVGGIQYKYRTRNYKNEIMSNDGEVSFYDASITNQQIDDLNTYGAHEVGDPFEDTERLEMTRSEYNNNARSGELVIKPDNINESEDFDWIEDSVDPLQPGLVYQTPNGNTLKIISVEATVVNYELYNTEENKIENIRIPKNTFIKWISGENGTHYWPRVSKMVNESEDFEWMKGVPANVYDAVNPGDHIVVTKVTEYLVDTLDYCGEEEHYISQGMGYRVDDIQDMKRQDVDCGLTADYYEWGKDGKQTMRSLKLVDDENGVVFWVTRDMVTIDWA